MGRLEKEECMIKLICVGRLDQDLKKIVNNYLKRIPKLKIIEVKESGKETEGISILRSIKDDFVIACDENGKMVNSKELAEVLKEKEVSGKSACFVIGGAYGLSEKALERADLKLGFSKMTFTYKMARLILVEQIYRAYCFNKGIDYGK